MLALSERMGPCRMSKLQLAGSYVALVTPFTDADEVDYAKIEELVDWHIAEGYRFPPLAMDVAMTLHTSLAWARTSPAPRPRRRDGLTRTDAWLLSVEGVAVQGFPGRLHAPSAEEKLWSSSASVNPSEADTMSSDSRVALRGFGGRCVVIHCIRGMQTRLMSGCEGLARAAPRASSLQHPAFCGVGGINKRHLCVSNNCDLKRGCGAAPRVSSRAAPPASRRRSPTRFARRPIHHHKGRALRSAPGGGYALSASVIYIGRRQLWRPPAHSGLRRVCVKIPEVDNP